MAASLALVLGAVLLQLVPLPAETIVRLSPDADAVLRDADLAYGAGLAPFHPISIDPRRTLVGAAFVVSLGTLLLGLARLVPGLDARRLCLAVMALGTVMALAGIVQKPLFGARVYGVWLPEFGRNPFGPFVNKNHFAGWMVMALSLSLGAYCGMLADARAGVKPGWRAHVLWLASPRASQILLAGVCLAVMALSLVLTFSRSGIACFAVAVLATGAVAARGRSSRRAIVSGYLALLVVAAVGWAGVDAVASRFAAADWAELNNRRGAWMDAWRIAMRFMPLGSGLNTYGVATRYFQTTDPRHQFMEAHNDYLQLLAEGGLLVTLPALLAAAAAADAIWHRFRAREDGAQEWWIRVGAVAGLLAMALQEVVEFSLQMPGNAVLFVLLLAIAMSPLRVRHSAFGFRH